MTRRFSPLCLYGGGFFDCKGRPFIRNIGYNSPKHKTFFITGGAGFFGGVLKRHLLQLGHTCVSIDLEADDDRHERLHSIRGDIADADLLQRVFAANKFDAVLHCAAMLAHEIRDEKQLWRSNVDGTARIAKACREHGVAKVVYISSNCLWARNFGRPVREDDTPQPVEIYGKSKWEGEKILLAMDAHFRTVAIRCPTIIDAGRIGLLGILFDFIREGRKVWVVGDGDNRYQFIYAGDLADACVQAMNGDASGVFNIGSDDVATLREVYEFVIARAGTAARVARLPQGPTLLAMKLAHALGVSPLGPYHYKMICEDFIFDTSKIKRELGWMPTLNNAQMLHKAYRFYAENADALAADADRSAHRRSAKMGVIRVLKWVS